MHVRLMPAEPTLRPGWAPLPQQVRIVRIFNTYGPRMALDDGRVVSNFVSQVRPVARLRCHDVLAAADAAVGWLVRAVCLFARQHSQACVKQAA